MFQQYIAKPVFHYATDQQTKILLENIHKSVKIFSGIRSTFEKEKGP